MRSFMGWANNHFNNLVFNKHLKQRNKHETGMGNDDIHVVPYMYMCIYIYIYIYTCDMCMIYVSILYMYIHITIHIHIHICMCKHIHIYVCVCMYICMYICVYIYIYICIYIYTQTNLTNLTVCTSNQCNSETFSEQYRQSTGRSASHEDLWRSGYK